MHGVAPFITSTYNMLPIRPETPADYPAINRVNVRAFGERLDEALIVALQRQSQRFDPELSLVAEQDGQPVGHALFSPCVIGLLGETVHAVLLGPIAVDPAYQRQGIGEALINEGHRVARSKGYSLSFLVGHPTYYPHFGYQTRAYGAATLEVRASELPAQEGEKSSLQTRRPLEADIPTLRELWLREEGRVDFAIQPGDDLIDWISPNPRIASTVYLKDSEVVGYTRVKETEPSQPRIFLARDAETARLMAGEMLSGGPSVSLPLHPGSTSARAFTGVPQCKAWEAAMAISLEPGLFDDYYAQVRAEQRPPGRVIWPVAFDMEV
jgi:predicted N-acetyltransferase YhbS